MEKVGNYAVIAGETFMERDGVKYGVVLGHAKTRHGDMYATWQKTEYQDEAPRYDWGHYYDDELCARADYHYRLADMNTQEDRG